MRKQIEKVNGRIDAMNGKFTNWKKVGLGAEDATARFGRNIPFETDSNFSAGYTGRAMVELRKAFKENK